MGGGEEQAAVGEERVVGHSHVQDATTVGCAKGLSPQAAAKPSDSMPSATFGRVVKFANPMTGEM